MTTTAKPTSVRLGIDLNSQLDSLVVATDRPKGWHIEQAIKRYLEEEAWQVQAISEAMASYKAGTAKLIPHDDVMAEIEALLPAEQR